MGQRLNAGFDDFARIRTNSTSCYCRLTVGVAHFLAHEIMTCSVHGRHIAVFGERSDNIGDGAFPLNLTFGCERVAYPPPRRF